MDVEINEIQRQIKLMVPEAVNEVCRTLDLLEGIYGQIHWAIYELIENSDNSGSKSIKFELNDNKLLVRNDGLEFSIDDFKRICSVNTLVGRDSLVDRSFGLGFKSVFSFSNDVKIFSGKFGIRFCKQKEHKLWKIFPHKIENQSFQEERNTVFEFDLGDKRENMSKTLFEVSPKILLFLRSVETLVIEDSVRGDTITLEKIIRKKNDLEIVTLRRTINEEACESWDYVCCSKEFSIPESIGDKGRTRVIVAVPLYRGDGSVSIYRKIYRVVGDGNAGFALSGDFITTMSFDELVDNDWNAWLLDSVSDYINSELKLGLMI